MKRLFHGVTIGITIGVMISLIFSTLFANTDFHPVSPESTMGKFYFEHLTELQIMGISVVIWALIGITFSFGELIFSNTNKTLLTQTLLHFSLMLIIMFPLAILAGWFPLKISAILMFVIIYTIVYFIIWTIEKRRNQRYIDEINDMLAKRKG
ncbi:DUF3021 domain-containing protein [Staphylococcus caeli]|uniref:DUF3021 domain-containing protein n=1 Tax=Staphylococcus caeli TaxID=2201815 RepID=UPI003F568199